jgi:hypothetical protein
MVDTLGGQGKNKADGTDNGASVFALLFAVILGDGQELG